MHRNIIAAIVLASSVTASADEIYFIDEWTILPGQSMTQTIRISGIDPLLDQVGVAHWGVVDFGLDWMEDWGEAPILWGNEYLHHVEMSSIGEGGENQILTYVSPYGNFFLYMTSFIFELDGPDYLSTVNFTLGALDQRCEIWMEEFATCGIRPFSAHFLADVLISGPNEAGAIITVSVGPTAPVPEPAAWLMMIAGFGLVGASLRRRVPAAA